MPSSGCTECSDHASPFFSALVWSGQKGNLKKTIKGGYIFTASTAVSARPAGRPPTLATPEKNPCLPGVARSDLLPVKTHAVAALQNASPTGLFSRSTRDIQHEGNCCDTGMYGVF